MECRETVCETPLGRIRGLDNGRCLAFLGVPFGKAGRFEYAQTVDRWDGVLDATRFGQFCVYLPLFALFFLLNNSKIMASMRTEATYAPGARGFLGTWWRCALMMVGGVLLIVLIEYVPFFLNIGPGADVFFGSTFGGPFMSLLILFVPQVLVFSLLGAWFYRRTGSVYPGALLIASLAAWIVTGGSAML